MVLPAPSFYPGRLASENVAGAVSIYLKANNIVVIVRVGEMDLGFFFGLVDSLGHGPSPAPGPPGFRWAVLCLS